MPLQDASAWYAMFLPAETESNAQAKLRVVFLALQAFKSQVHGSSINGKRDEEVKCILYIGVLQLRARLVTILFPGADSDQN